MVFVTQNDLGGLGPAISNIGSVLGQALQQHGQRQQQKMAQQNLLSTLGQESTLGKIIGAVGLENAQKLSGLLSPILSEEAKQQGVGNFFKQFSPSSPTGESPLDIPRNMPNIQIGEEESIETPQGTFQNEDIVDLPAFGKIPKSMISAALIHPNPQLRKWGEGAQNALLQQQKISQKESSEKEKRAFEINKPLYEKVNKIQDNQFGTQLALTRLEDSLTSGNIRPFIDWAAGELGFEPGKATDAQVLESAAKELFIKNLEGVTGVRFNQLLEKILREAGPNLGKSPAANQEFLEAAYIIEDVKNKYVEIFNDLEQEFDRRGLELPKNASKLIKDKLRPYEAQKIKEYNEIKKDISKGKITSNKGLLLRKAKREIRNELPPQGTKWIMAPNGEIKSIPFDLLKKAKDAGGVEINER